MSRGLFRCELTKPKAALFGSRLMSVKYGLLKAFSASARTWKRIVSLMLKFFVSDRLAIENGWLRSLGSVVGTLRRAWNEVSLMKPLVSKAGRSMPYFR